MGIAEFAARYSPYLDGTAFALIVLCVVGYYGHWLEQCHFKRIYFLCCQCLEDRQYQFVFAVAFILWLLFLIIFILDGLVSSMSQQITHPFWLVGHYLYCVIYPLFAIYIVYYLSQIHKQYTSILVYYELKHDDFMMFICILLMTLFVTALEWMTVINRTDWETSDESIQIALALFCMDATAIMLIFKMKQIESISWAFASSLQYSGFEALEITFNQRFKYCTCNTLLFVYFGIGVLFQLVIVFLVTYTTVENRLNDAETLVFYSTLPFVFAPLFILTYLIHKHHTFIVSVDYTTDDKDNAMDVDRVSAIIDGSVDPDQLKERQKKLNTYKCMDRIYQLLVVLIFICSMYLTLIAALQPYITTVEADLYLFSSFDNLYYVFIFLLLLFLESKEHWHHTWQCEQCTASNDMCQSNGLCLLCGSNRNAVHADVLDEATPLLSAVSTTLLKVKDNKHEQHDHNRIHKTCVKHDIEIRTFGTDYMNQIQCPNEERNTGDPMETLKNCRYLQRIVSLSILYENYKNEGPNEFSSYFEDLTSEKGYDIPDVLNDFAHLLRYHSFGVNNQNAFDYVEGLVGNCGESCSSARRHFGERQDRADNDTDATATDNHHVQLLHRTMDRIHCFLFHNVSRDRDRDHALVEMKELVDNNEEEDDEDTGLNRNRQYDPTRQRYDEMKYAETMEKKDETEFAEFGFGSFIYYELLSPKFASLKEELQFNEMYRIQTDLWDALWEKALHLSKTNTAKHSSYKRDAENMLQCMSIEHILSVTLYTDCDKLQFSFRASFRKNSASDTSETIIKRHCKNYYHWGKLLNESIYTFGDQMTQNERLYHGLSKKMLFCAFSTDFNTPTSTTTSRSIAQRFSGSSGIVLVLKPKWKEISHWNRSKHLDVSWISDHADEQEHLFYGNFNQLLMDEIYDMTNDGQPIKEYMKALQLLQMMCDGNVGNDEYNMDTVQKGAKYNDIYGIALMKLMANELKMNDIPSHVTSEIYEKASKNMKRRKRSAKYLMNEIPRYVERLMHHFCVHRESVAILNGIGKMNKLIRTMYHDQHFVYSVFMHCMYCRALMEDNRRYKEVMKASNIKNKIFQDRNCSHCYQSIIDQVIKSKKREHMDHEILADTFYVCCNMECDHYLRYSLCESCLIKIPSDMLRKLFPNAAFFYTIPVLTQNKQNALKVELLRSIGFL